MPILDGIEYMNMKEAVKESGYSSEHLRNLAGRKILDALKMDGKWLFSRDSLVNYRSRLHPDMPDYFTINQLQELTGYSRGCLTNSARKGKLKNAKKLKNGSLGSIWYVQDIEEFSPRKKPYKQNRLTVSNEIPEGFIPASESNYCFTNVYRLIRHGVRAVRLAGKNGYDSIYISRDDLEEYKSRRKS